MAFQRYIVRGMTARAVKGEILKSPQWYVLNTPSDSKGIAEI
jgi:hypothetical protein